MNIFSIYRFKKIFLLGFVLLLLEFFHAKDVGRSNLSGNLLGAAPNYKINEIKRIDKSSKPQNLFAEQKKKDERNKLHRQYSQLLKKMKEGRYDRVISGCRDIIYQDYTFFRAYKLLVQASKEKSRQSSSENELKKTINFFQRLIENSPANYYYYYGLGLCYKKKKNYLKAIENLEKSIKLGADFWDVYEELITYCRHKKDLERTRDFFITNIKFASSNSHLYQGLGLIHFMLSDYSQALANLEKALGMQKKGGSKYAEGRCLYYIGYVYHYLNNYPKALEFLEQCLRISKESGNKANEAECLNLISFIYTSLGNYSQGLELCEQALVISWDIGDKKIENLCLRTLGVIYRERGNLLKAQEYLEQSLRFFQEIEDMRNQTVCLYWITIVYQDKGDYSKALEYSKKALKISQQMGFKTVKAFNLNTVGDIYLSLGNYTKALEYNKQALKIAKRYIGKWSREKCLNTIGFVYIEINDFQKALKYFKQALEYILQIGHKREEARCLYNIGYAYLKMDNHQRALEYFLKSLRRAQQSGNKMIQAFNFNSLGDLYFKQGNYLKSKEYYSKALSIGQEIGQPNIIWEAYSGLGSVYTQQKKFNQAVDHYKKAVEVIEDIRSHLQLREYSSGFFKSKISIYENIVNLLYDLHSVNTSEGYDKDCFYYAEKAKARAFLDDLQEAKIDFGTIGLPKARQDEIEILSRRISQILTNLNKFDLPKKKRAELLKQLEEAEDDLQGVIEIIKRENPDYTNMIYHEPYRLREIQNKLLDRRTGLIEYFVGKEGLFIFLVTWDDLYIYKMPSDVSKSTRKLVNNYIKLLSSKDISSFDGEIASKKLYEKLILPVTDVLSKEIENLIIVPDRDLYYLPFETLIAEGRSQKAENRKKKSKIQNLKSKIRFLMEDFKISYAPSASTLVNILEVEKKQRRQKDLLAIGDPVYDIGKKQFGEPIKADDIIREYYLEKRFNLYPLLFASKEIKSISKLIKKGFRLTISQEKATEENVKKLPLADYKIIHFATHSFLDERVANRSALVLTLDDDPAEDGFFQVREIYNTKLNADLVVLSACQTAKGKMEKGEGIQGLSRAFFCAGTKSVLASLWNINDKSTAEFMRHFYQYLAQGKTKQEALRLTKIKMLSSKYNHPYYWAAFVLVGDAHSKIVLSKPSFWEKLFFFF